MPDVALFHAVSYFWQETDANASYTFYLILPKMICKVLIPRRQMAWLSTLILFGGLSTRLMMVMFSQRRSKKQVPDSAFYCRWQHCWTLANCAAAWCVGMQPALSQWSGLSGGAVEVGRVPLGQ